MSHMEPIYNDQGSVVEWYDKCESFIVLSVPLRFLYMPYHSHLRLHSASRGYVQPDLALLLCNNTRRNFRGNARIPSGLTFSYPKVNDRLPDVPDQIIMCQWYLDAALASAYRDSGDFDNFFTQSSQYWQHQQPTGSAPIDLFYLFDSGLAHEVSVYAWLIPESNPPPNKRR